MRNIIIISGLAIMLLTSCRDYKEPVFSNIQNVKVPKPGLKKSVMTFDMQYFNPNNSKAQLKEAAGDAWLDSTYLGRFNVDTIVDIPANSNFIIPVRLELDMKNMIKHSLATYLNEFVVIKIKGMAKVGKGGFYKRFPLNYEGKQNLKELFK